MKSTPLHRTIFIIFIFALAMGCKKEFVVSDKSQEFAGTYIGTTRRAHEKQSGSAQPILSSDTTYLDTVAINKINENSISIQFVGDKIFTTFSDDKFDYRFTYSSWTFFNAKFNKKDSVVISGNEGSGSGSGYQITHYQFSGKKS